MKSSKRPVYDIIQAEQLMVDEVDRDLNCVRVKWDRKEGVHSKGSAPEASEFVLIDGISGKIHVVAAYGLIHLLRDDVRRSRVTEVLGNGILT